ncbi:uncharacterized protein LOC144493034 [Mustelus asterias]
MKSSLATPKRRASTCVSTKTASNTVVSAASKRNSVAPSQCRHPLLTRENPCKSRSKIPQTELRQQAVSTNNLKTFESTKVFKKRASSVSNVKNRPFGRGSLSLNSTQKLSGRMDIKCKMAALPNENSLNATYCLPNSGDKSTRQIPLKTKNVDGVMVQQNVPNISVSDSIFEREHMQSAHCPPQLMEPSYVSPLFSSFVAEECLHIAAELSSKSETSPLCTVDAINPVPAANVSMINEEPVPFDCSVFSCCSETPPAKLPLGGSTSKLQEEGLTDDNRQLVLTEAEIKTEDSPVSAKMNNDIETETLPWSPARNLIQLNETMVPSDPNDHDDDAPKHDVYSNNVLSKSPTISNCELLPPTVDLIQLTEIKGSGASNTQSLGARGDASCESFMPAKTLPDCNLLLSKVDQLFERSMQSDENLILPMHKGSFDNETKAPVLLDYKPSLATPDLIQLNETITLQDKNVTFDLSGHEITFGNDLQANDKQAVVQLNGTMTVDDHKNTTFETSKYEDLGNDCKVTNLSNCRLPLSEREMVQLNGTMTMDDHKNSTFDAQPSESKLKNDSNALVLSNCELLQLNNTTTLGDHKDATFDALPQEGNLENDLPILSNCELLQLNNTTTLGDHKDATFDALPQEGNLENDLPILSNCELLQLNNTTVDDHKNATFDAPPQESNLENDCKAPVLSDCELLLPRGDREQSNGIVNVNDCTATFDASKRGNSLEINPSKLTNLPDCRLSLSSGSLTEARFVRKCAPDCGSELERVKETGKSSISNLTLNLEKRGDSICLNKISNKTNQGGNVNCSTELPKGDCALKGSVHLRETSQNKEISICEQADLVDMVNSEWAPHCMSTPCFTGRQSFPEYLRLDHSFLASTSTLQDSVGNGVGECPEEQDSTKDVGRSSDTTVTEIKTCPGKDSNAPRPGLRLQQTKIATENSLKHVSHLPGAVRKNVSQAPVSEAHKYGAQNDSIPPPARTCKVGCSAAVGRGGKPPMQPPSFSKMHIPKPRIVSGRPNSAIGIGQSTTNNKVPSCHAAVTTKIPLKAETNQPLTKAISKIPEVRKRSSLVTSKLTVQATKADSKLPNIGMAGHPHVNRKANNSLVLASQNDVTSIKRRNSAMEQKRTPSPPPKKSKTAGEVTAKFQMKTKPLPCKQKVGMKAGKSRASEPKVKLNKTAKSTCKSEQKEVAELQRRNQELEEKIVMLELQNAALRQGKENLSHLPEEGSDI